MLRCQDDGAWDGVFCVGEDEEPFCKHFDGFLLAIGYWFGVDGVAVIIVEDEDVVVAGGGWNNKAAIKASCTLKYPQEC